MATIGILHPGEMGAAVGAALVACGHDVLWATAGRSPASRARADQAGLRAVADVATLARACELVLSICPPDAALAVARSARDHAGIFVDANAVSPGTALAAAAAAGGRCADGSIVGPPPSRAGATRLYLSGAEASAVAELFTGARIDARVLAVPDPTAASSLKMTYAAWTKGTSALLLAIDAAAQELGVSAELAEEWSLSQPELAARLGSARAAAAAKGWRWEGEMRQIAATLLAAGQPGGFHEAAATIFGRSPRDPGA
jgi:3-hydroxyisobutyrate dehydrogenase-like beta-hydroxyacid dehydrogenase